MTQTVILPTWTGNLSQEKKMELIDDVRWRILPDARAAQAEVLDISNRSLQDRKALAEADYLGHLLTNLLLTLVIEEDGVK